MSTLCCLIQRDVTVREHSSDLKWPEPQRNLLINGVIVGRFINMNKFELNYNLCSQFDILDYSNSLSCLQIINNSPVLWWFQRFLENTELPLSEARTDMITVSKNTLCSSKNVLALVNKDIISPRTMIFRVMIWESDFARCRIMDRGLGWRLSSFYIFRTYSYRTHFTFP